MAEQRLKIESDGPIAIVTLTRRDKRNAIDEAMLAALNAACERLEADNAVRAVILAAEGKAFSTGGDITAWAALSPRDFGQHWVRRGHRLFDRLAQLRQPVIAVIGGAALGGGLELAACADLRIAEPGAAFAMPEARLGMVPGWSGTQRLVRRFGAQAVRRMALAGEVLGAEAALAAGIVDQVTAEGMGLAAARAVAARMAERGPLAMEAVKLMIAAAEGEATESAVEALASILVAGTDELKEGVASFREKRKPSFPG